MTSSPQEFLYSIPDTPSHLTEGSRVALQIGAIASGQVENLRTRCNHVDGRAENVAEHSFMLAKVAPELASLLHPELDQNLVARYATVHDDVEIYVGDTPTDLVDKHDEHQKEELEARGVAKLLEEYAHIPSYCAVVKSYEAQDAPEARFVRAVDKLMVLLIHVPDKGATLREIYSYDSFLQSEKELVDRDRYKYGEFDSIVGLRIELGQHIADSYLKT